MQREAEFSYQNAESHFLLTPLFEVYFQYCQMIGEMLSAESLWLGKVSLFWVFCYLLRTCSHVLQLCHFVLHYNFFFCP